MKKDATFDNKTVSKYCTNIYVCVHLLQSNLNPYSKKFATQT